MEDAGYSKIEKRIAKHEMVSSMYVDAIKAKLETYNKLTRYYYLLLRNDTITSMESS
jgi:hypothetical protein